MSFGGLPHHRSAAQDVLGEAPNIDPLPRICLGEPPTSIRCAGYAWGNPHYRSAVQDALGGVPNIDPLLRMHLGEAPHTDLLCRMGVGGSVFGGVQGRDGEKRPFLPKTIVGAGWAGRTSAMKNGLIFRPSRPVP